MEKSVLEKIEVPEVSNRYNMTSTSQQYPAPEHNGAVPNINDPRFQNFASVPYKLYKESGPALYGQTNRWDMVGHIHKPTPLNEVFFSEANINKLQEEIHDQVMLMSNGKYDIGRQNDDDLKIIMRSYYLMFSQNNPMTVASELAGLNSRVVGYAASKVYSEVDFHMFYRKDLEEFAPPIANPMNANVYGSRTGELKSFF